MRNAEAAVSVHRANADGRSSGLPDSGARAHAMFHVMLPGRLPGFLRETVNRA